MEPLDLLLDTSILIKIWRGDDQLEREVRALSCGIETVACLEFLQGAKKSQLARAEKFLKGFEFVAFTPTISFEAIRLVKKYSHSKGLRMPDALIAATAMETQVPLLTLNIKDFDFIDGLNLI